MSTAGSNLPAHVDDPPVPFDGPVTVRGTFEHSPPPPTGARQPPGPSRGVLVREPGDSITHDLYVVDVAGHDVALELPAGAGHPAGTRLHVTGTIWCSRARTLAFSDPAVRPIEDPAA